MYEVCDKSGEHMNQVADLNKPDMMNFGNNYTLASC